MFENVDNTHTYERTTEAYLYYKLTNEPKGSGELKIHKQFSSRNGSLTQPMHHSDDIKIKLFTTIKQRKVLLAKPKSTASQSKRKTLVEPRRAKPKTNQQAPTHSLKLYEEALTESEARTTTVQLKSEA